MKIFHLIISGYYTNEFFKLFAEFNLLAAASIIIGIVLIVFQYNHNNNNILYLFGILFLLMGVTARLISDGSFFMTFLLLVTIAVILILSYLFILVKNKKAWLIKASTLSVNLEITDAKNDYLFLLGLEGDAITDISPNGNVKIGDTNFYVTSEYETNIPKGKRVRISNIDNNTIYIIPTEPENVDNLDL